MTIVSLCIRGMFIMAATVSRVPQWHSNEYFELHSCDYIELELLFLINKVHRLFECSNVRMLENQISYKFKLQIKVKTNDDEMNN